MKSFSRGSFGTLLLAAGLLFSNVQQSQAQENGKRHVGLTGSIQGGQSIILVPIWLGEMMTLAPGIALSYQENSSTNITLLVSPRFYMAMQRVAPYITASVGIDFSNPVGPADQTDLIVAIGLGGEYFINTMFSLGVQALLNARIADISGAQSLGASTSTGVHANVYF